MHIILQSVRTASCLLLLFVIGCHHEPYLDDDEGAQQPSSGADSLSLPYAQGTKVRIAVVASGADGQSTWKLQSDNPAVLAVDKLALSSDNPPQLTADCTAVAAGETVLRLLDGSGAELRKSSVSVAIPDRIRVLAHGQLRLVEQNADALNKTEVHEARILSGSQGVFAVVYQKGEQRLYGRGLVQLDPVSGVTVTNQTTSGAPINEWLFIKTTSTGSYSLTLRRGQTATTTLPIVSVPQSDIGSFTLVPQQVAAPKMDQTLWAFLQVRDMQSRDIYGVYGTWTLNGAAQSKGGGNTQDPTGDLYRYNYADGASQELAATRGALRTAMTISVSKGAVYDTTYLGCSMGGQRPGGSPVAPLVIFATLGLWLALSSRRRTTEKTSCS